MNPGSELYKQIIQNQPVVLLERIQVEQQKSDSTSDGMKKPKRALEKSTTETNLDENEQRSKRKRCSHCVEIAVLKQDNEQLLRQANELQVQLNYLSTIVEEVVDQQLQMANANVETSQQIAELSNGNGNYMDVDQQATEMDLSLEEQQGSGCNIM